MNTEEKLQRVVSSFRLEGQELSQDILSKCRMIIENKISAEDAINLVLGGVKLTYVISDMHFQHFNCIRYTSREFENSEEMDEAIIKKWNLTVGNQDRVLMLGDAFLCREDKRIEIAKRLNGEVFVILGNHDSAGALIKLGWKIVAKKHEIYREDNIAFVHDPNDANEEIGFVVHGHTHRLMMDSPRFINACCENWNYFPISMDTIKEEMSIRNKKYKLNLF